jgi:hypothetical protein
MGEFRSAGFGREAQGTPCGSKGQVVGGLFLCLLSFGQAKEGRAGALSTAHQKYRASAHMKKTNRGRAPPSAQNSRVSVSSAA